MAYVVPNEGEVKLLADLLAGGSLENWTLKLFKSNTTPAETDTAATYTEADFTGYAAKTLTRSVSGSTWSTPASAAPAGSWSAEASVAASTYGAAAQVFSCTGTGNTIYGYYIVGATSGKLILAETFATARVLSNGDSIQMSPYLGAA
jgi:hypothetical protein